MAISATWPASLKEFVALAKLPAADLNTYVSNALSYLYTYGAQRATSFPGSPVTGQLCWRTDFTPQRLYSYTGGAWQLLIGNVSARAYNNANISLTNNTVTTLTLNSERYDTDTIHNPSSNTSRLTAPIAGLYNITAQVQFEANGTGNRQVLIIVNGSTLIAASALPAVSGSTTHVVCTTQYRLAASDYLEVQAYQNSGGALLSVSTGNTSPEFMMSWIGG